MDTFTQNLICTVVGTVIGCLLREIPYWLWERSKKKNRKESLRLAFVSCVESYQSYLLTANDFSAHPWSNQAWLSNQSAFIEYFPKESAKFISATSYESNLTTSLFPGSSPEFDKESALSKTREVLQGL